MTLTAHDVRHVTFARPRLPRQGYAEGDVDPFLETVAQTIEEHEKTIKSLETKIAVLAAKPEPPTAPIPVVRDEPESESAQVSRVLELATKAADQHKQEALDVAARILEEARVQAEKIQTSSNEAATRLLARTREQAKEIQDAADEAQRRADDLEVLLQGLRSNLVPYFEQNLEDLDRLVPVGEDPEAPAGAHAQE